jgi:hypothetical protein
VEILFSASNCWKCSIFSKKNPIIRIFYISGWFNIPINPDKRSSTVDAADKEHKNFTG